MQRRRTLVRLRARAVTRQQTLDTITLDTITLDTITLDTITQIKRRVNRPSPVQQ